MLKQSQVIMALEQAAARCAASLNLQLAYPNSQFTPPAGEPWLEVNVMPADSTSVTLEGGDRNDLGVMQISVNVPPNTGVSNPRGLADAIAEYFPHNGNITEAGEMIWFDDAPVIARGISTETVYFIPVSINYSYVGAVAR